jgi:photosystem II stability/assembly factor-like uncharacterized protein
MSLAGKIAILTFLSFFSVQIAQGQWRRQDSGTLTNLHSIYFVDSQHGWVVGARGTFLTTVDGGDNWRRHKGITSDLIRDVYFSDRKNGWLLCETPIHNVPERSPSYLLRTSDGGSVWEKVPLKESRDRLVRFFFTKRGLGFVIGEGGGIWQLPDDKYSLKRSELPSRFLIFAGTFTDDLNGILVGAGGTVLITSSGGDEWNRAAIPAGGKTRLNSVFFIDRKAGWIAGDQGKILATSNGGRVWREQRSGVDEDLADIFFVNSTDGFAVGDKGRIVETRTAGSTWTVADAGVKSPLERVYFVGEKGFAIGFGGVILRYTGI